MTTTKASLDRVEEIVDEYLRLDLGSIFLRALSPYGFAIKTKQFARYGGHDWLTFYERGLRYIIDVNRHGRHFPEFYASLLLKRMLSDQPIGYVDLRSPAGIGLGALVYNYDGKVFASYEGRMLAEMGDRTIGIYQQMVDGSTNMSAFSRPPPRGSRTQRGRDMARVVRIDTSEYVGYFDLSGPSNRCPRLHFRRLALFGRALTS